MSKKFFAPVLAIFVVIAILLLLGLSSRANNPGGAGSEVVSPDPITVDSGTQFKLNPGEIILPDRWTLGAAYNTPVGTNFKCHSGDGQIEFDCKFMVASPIEVNSLLPSFTISEGRAAYLQGITGVTTTTNTINFAGTNTEFTILHTLAPMTGDTIDPSKVQPILIYGCRSDGLCAAIGPLSSDTASNIVEVANFKEALSQIKLD